MPSGFVKLIVRRTASYEVDLPLDAVLPGGRVGVLEVGHEDARARVERVDDHLAIHRPGDLDAAVLQIGRDRRDGPCALADLARLRQEVVARASVERCLTFDALLQELDAAVVELAVQRGEEGQRFRREDGGELRCDLRLDA